MNITSSTKTLGSISYLCAAISVFLLILAPHSARAGDTEAKDLIATSESKGILETSAGLYEFTPSTCGIYEQDGVYDIEVHGPGTAPDGEKLYFEFSSTANAVTVKLGVDAPFKTSDRNIQGGQFVSKPFTLEVAGEIISVTDLALVDNQGQPVDANANLWIDCSV